MVQEQRQGDIGQRVLERLIALSPGEFEHLVAEFLRSKGFSYVEVTGQSGDGGIDGHCEIPFIKLKVAFQAKRYATGNNVGIEPVQRLQGSLGRSFDRGVFITTSDFTVGARSWVEEQEAPISLIKGAELVEQMVELGLGVKRVPMVKEELDEDFFADLGPQS